MTKNLIDIINDLKGLSFQLDVYMREKEKEEKELKAYKYDLENLKRIQIRALLDHKIKDLETFMKEEEENQDE